MLEIVALNDLVSMLCARKFSFVPQGGDLGKGLGPGVGILVKKFCPGVGGGAIFTLKNCLNMQFFSKNILFYEKLVPRGGEYGKNSWPGGGEFGQNFWPGGTKSPPLPGGVGGAKN